MSRVVAFDRSDQLLTKIEGGILEPEKYLTNGRITIVLRAALMINN